MIRLLIMDVDGTLTDGKIYMSPSGEIMKVFNVKDGCGIHDILIPGNIKPVIITGRYSEIVTQRCNELGISDVYQSIPDKLKKLMEITKCLSEVAYIGDDINDLPCMLAIKAAGGIIGCPSDAIIEIKKIADYVSEYSGGNGAVRDFINMLVRLNVDAHNM